jgi:hypothetical protein
MKINGGKPINWDRGVRLVLRRRAGKPHVCKFRGFWYLSTPLGTASSALSVRELERRERVHALFMRKFGGDPVQIGPLDV